MSNQPCPRCGRPVANRCAWRPLRRLSPGSRGGNVFRRIECHRLHADDVVGCGGGGGCRSAEGAAAERRRPVGQLSDRAAPRARRHGRGLRRGTPPLGPARGAESVEQPAAERRGAGAVSARRAAGGLRQPSAHGLHLRQRGDRRHAGHLDGAAARRHAEGSRRRPRPDARRRSRRGGAGADRRPRRRGGRRHPAPRHQALELLRRSRRRRQGGRFRAVDLDAGARRPSAAGDVRLRGHAAVCAAGAAARGAARRAGGHLCRRRDAVLPADRTGAVRRARSARALREGDERDAGAAASTAWRRSGVGCRRW